MIAFKTHLDLTGKFTWIGKMAYNISNKPWLTPWKPTHTDQYLHCSSHRQRSCKESFVPPCLMQHISALPIDDRSNGHKYKASVKGEWTSL